VSKKQLLIFFLIVATALQASAQSSDDLQKKHSVGVSWDYMGYNSTHSKNSDKKTFGTVGVKYSYHCNKWISVNGKAGWSHAWFGDDADPLHAYPKKDNAILLLAGCDVSWFQKGIIQLHSGVAGGVDVRVQKNDRGSYTTVGLAGQFDALGLKLDWDRIYVDMSAGWGSMGCVRLGVGFKL